MVTIQIGVRLVSLPRRKLLTVPSVSVRGEVWAAHWEPTGNYLPGTEDRLVWRVLSPMQLGPSPVPQHSVWKAGSSLEGICLHSWVCHR